MRTFTSEAPNRLTHFSARLSALSAAAVLGVTAFAVVAPAAPAQAHDQLTGVQIETSETGEATGLKLSFSDNILEVGTEIIVTDATGASIADGGPKHSGRDIVQPLKTPLADGKNSTVWRVVSSDGHPIEGGFSFETTDGIAGEILTLDASSVDPEVSEEGEHDHEHEGEHSHSDEEHATGIDSAAEPEGSPLAAFAPFIGIGAGLAAIVVIAAVIMRARKNTAARNISQDSPEQE